MESGAIGRPRVSDRALRWSSALGSAIFLVLISISARLYPGGTWTQRKARGHSLWENYLCDLMQTRALNGVEAPIGSLLARVGTVAMFVAVGAFFVQVARLQDPKGRAARWSAGAGLLAASLGASVAFFPSNEGRTAHLAVVVGAFIPSVFAVFAASIVTWRHADTPSYLRALAILTLVTGTLDGLLYAFVHAAPSLDLVPASPRLRRLILAGLPRLQRVATFGLFAWVCAMTAWSSRRDRWSARDAF